MAFSPALTWARFVTPPDVVRAPTEQALRRNDSLKPTINAWNPWCSLREDGHIQLFRFRVSCCVIVALSEEMAGALGVGVGR